MVGIDVHLLLDNGTSGVLKVKINDGSDNVYAYSRLT